MRILALCVLAFVLAALSGCASTQSDKSVSQPTVSQTESSAGVARNGAPDTANTSTTTASAPRQSTIQDGAMKPASLQSAQNSQASVTVTERKLIRNAEMLLESANPADSQRRIASIAEAHGGFVVSSESRQVNAEGQLKPETSATVILRVPSAQFDTVINEIRGSGTRSLQDKITTQDVTEEYIDLEARIRAKQALEAQFMEIMKRANTVEDALEVQSQLSDVRSEIERLEGRRRFLENQTSLSTVTVNIQPPSQIVSSTGFLYSVRRAFNDGLDVAATITLGLVRIFIALLPLLIFIVLPIVLFLRYMIRRAQRKHGAEDARMPVVETVPQPPPTVTTT